MYVLQHITSYYGEGGGDSRRAAQAAEGGAAQTTDRSAVGCRIRRARAAAKPTRADRSESNRGRSARSGGRPWLRKRRATHERPPGEAASRAWGEAASRAGGEGREGASRAPPACRPPTARTTSRRLATDPPTGSIVPRETLYRILCCRGMFYNIKS